MFKKETVDIAKMDVNALSYTESANRMRKLLKTGKNAFLLAVFRHCHFIPLITISFFNLQKRPSEILK